MKHVLNAIEPKALWANFEKLNAVPRASKKEERVIAFMRGFGEGLGLETTVDHVGNVLIRKPATKGLEDRKMVTLQAHLDMVHQKNADTDFDFDAQGIAMEVDGDWVRAKGTTLGADNGLGVAAIMALLQSDDVPHPPLEALFTIDEETGMTGAFGVSSDFLKGDILLNLDTEEDDEIDIGCAGGIDITATGQYKIETPKDIGVCYRITVKGLQGGHSGMDIHKGLGNANKIMNRLLYQLDAQCGIRISSIDGGGLRNAIPRESRAIFALKKDAKANVHQVFENVCGAIKKELAFVEPKLVLELAQTDVQFVFMAQDDQKRLLRSLYAAHNGVYAMSAAIAGLVETSNNVAKVHVSEGHITIGCLTRSSVETAKMDLAHALRSAFELGGLSVTMSGSYPGWQPDPDSEILKLTKKVYTQLFNKEPRVVACHAGLECGILGQHYPKMDMVSFGPTILGAHSPEERASIPSAQKFWKFLLAVLQEIPVK